MRVLLVEDDRRLAAAVSEGLARAGIGTVTAGDGAAALESLDAEEVDVVVLDVMLPGPMDGFEVCNELRRRRIRTPVLMVTALDTIDERVRGLEAGADDYLVKPFALRELIARLRALLRRHLDGRTAVLHAGDLELDTRTMQAAVHGRSIPLTTTEQRLLEYLMLHPGQVLGRLQIEDRVWTSGLPGDSNLLEVYIGRLRRKIRDAGAATAIETVRRAGYRLLPG